MGWDIWGLVNIPDMVRSVAVRRKKVAATLHILSITSCPSCPTPLYFLPASLFYGHFGHLHPAPSTQMDTFRSTSAWSTQPDPLLDTIQFLFVLWKISQGSMSEFFHCICIACRFLWPPDLSQILWVRWSSGEMENTDRDSSMVDILFGQVSLRGVRGSREDIS